MSSVSLLDHRRDGLGDDFFTHATSARVYHYLLGGSENYEADRKAARAVWGAADWVKTAAAINRDFILQSVAFSLRLGVRQFLDLGCGYPTTVNVHEITQETHPTQPVVYVDRDPGVYAHGRSQLDERPGVTVLRADILAMDDLLTCEAMRTAVNLKEPVAVLMGDVLPWCPDDAAVHRAMAALRTWMPPGSTLSLSHLTDHWHRATMPTVSAAYAEHGLHIRPRSREEILDLFGDLAQQGPGLTATGRWHEAGPHALRPEDHSAAFAGIALKPASRSPQKAALAASRPRSEEPAVIQEPGPGESQHLIVAHHLPRAGAVPVPVRRTWGLPDLPTAQIVAGNYLRYLRESHGLQVSDVCRLIGVSHSEMTRIESGSRPLTQQQAHTLLAGPYQVSPAARDGFDQYLYEAPFMPQGVMVDAGVGWPDRLAALEHRAVAGRIYAERLIPGLCGPPATPRASTTSANPVSRRSRAPRPSARPQRWSCWRKLF